MKGYVYYAPLQLSLDTDINYQSTKMQLQPYHQVCC